MPITIAPGQINDRDAKNLFQFFKNAAQRNEKVWLKGTSFHMNGMDYTFGYTTIERRRSLGKEGVRYELISDTVQGLGCEETKVFKVASTMILNEKQITFKNYGSSYTSTNKAGQKKRVVKIQYHLSSEQKKEVLNEYEMTYRAGHLAIKPPMIDTRTSYTVMREAKGVELFELLGEDLQEKVVLSSLERLELTKALLFALKTQVSDKGLVHRDIRPENIMVDKSEESFSITIIDYARSHVKETNPGDVGGCLTFSSPEAFDVKPCTVKSDIFSMGRILAIVWRGLDHTYGCNDKVQAARNAKNAIFGLRQARLFSGLDDSLSEENRKIIRSAIESMLRKDPESRASIEDILAAFNKVDLQESKKPTYDVPEFNFLSMLPTFITSPVQSFSNTIMSFFFKREPENADPIAAPDTVILYKME